MRSFPAAAVLVSLGGLFPLACGSDDDSSDVEATAGRGGSSPLSTGGSSTTTGGANTTPAGGAATSSGGQTLDSGGTIGATGDTCGGMLGIACEQDSYCDYPIEAQCGAADQTGSCQPIPQMCTADYTPVCGCDGNTYSNSCGAASAGVSVSSTGECS